MVAEPNDSIPVADAIPRKTADLLARSPIAGKLFDETGDRLTPTHTKRLRLTLSKREWCASPKTIGGEGDEGHRDAHEPARR